MTDSYGAFSTSTSTFPGQIQSNIIDTSCTSILTCLYNNENLKIIWVKCSPVSAPPTPSWGWAMGSRVTPSPVHPHEGAPMRSYCDFFIFEAKSLICSLVIAFLLLSRGVALFWCKFVSVLCCSELPLFVSKFGKRVEPVLFLISFNLKLPTAWIFW